MPYAVAVVLTLLWLVGMAASFMLGGLIHVLLIVAIALTLYTMASGRRPP